MSQNSAVHETYSLLKKHTRDDQGLKRKLVATFLIFSLLTSQFLSIFIPPVYAATSPWTQTDWSGGSGQTSWSDATKYSSATSSDTSTTAGQVTLAKQEKFSNTGFESDLTGWTNGPASTYALEDQFTTNASAPLTSPRTAEPGPGTLTIVGDTNNKISISSNKLNFATGGITNSGLWSTTQFSRQAGRAVLGTVNQVSNSINGARLGWDSDQTGAVSEYIRFVGGNTLQLNSVDLSEQWATTDHQVAVIQRGTGMFYFIKGGSYTNWTLLWVGNTGSSAVYPAIQTTNASGIFTTDDFRVTDLPAPFTTDYGAASIYTASPSSITPTLGSELLTDGGLENWNSTTDLTSWTETIAGTSTINKESSVIHGGSFAVRQDIDSSNSAATLQGSITNAATDWLNITFWLRSSASGKTGNTNMAGTARDPGTTWTQYTEIFRAGGTNLNPRFRNVSAASGSLYWDDISIKKITLSSLFGSTATGPTSYVAEIAPTLTSGTQAGMVLNLDSTSSPSNFLLAYHDGSQAKLDKVVNGTYTNLIAANATYSAGARLVAIKDGTSVSLYYNNAKIGATQTVSDAGIINNTLHGVFSTYASNTFSNFVVWPRTFADLGEESTGTVTRDTGITYSSSAGSAKIVAPSGYLTNYTQSVNVGDTNSYNLSAYVRTDGSAVTSSDLSLYYNGSPISTTYTSAGNGWYRLTGQLTGANAARNYGVQVEAGKTVYLDNMSLDSYATSGTLTSSIFDSGQGSNWGTLSYTATTPTNTTVSVKVRSSNSSSMSGATAFSSCVAIASGADISTNSCVTDTHRYIQYELTLTTTETLATTPTFQDVTINFAVSDADGPVFDLDHPEDNSYTNAGRPSLRWKMATDAASTVADYDLIIDNPAAGEHDPSGDFTISDIPLSRTTDYETPKYTVHYDGFNDSDLTNNYISVATKSNSEWNSSELDGKLREGKVFWKVKATDSVGNYTEHARNVFVDRTDPKVELTQVNNTPFSSTAFSTTDKTPTIFGKLTDPLAGTLSEVQTQDQNGPKIASGPKQIDIKVEKKEGSSYKIITLYTINMDKPWYICDNTEVADNSKQKCDKYLPFEYTPKENLDLGTYKITLTGKDKADNTSSETSFTLHITTLAQITTPEEKELIEETLQPAQGEKELTPEEKNQIRENLEITKALEPSQPNALENVVNATGNFISALLTGISHRVQNTVSAIGSGIAFVLDKAGQGLAYVGNGIATAFTNAVNTIGRGYTHLANNAPGAAKDILVSIGNSVNATGQAISTTAKAAQEGAATLAFGIGEKVQDVSDTAGLAIIKFTYNFVSEPTRIYDVKVAVLSPTSAKISWETNHPANGKVNYGLDETYPLDIQTDKRTTHHEFTLENLTPDTEYHFEVMSQNKNYVYDANRKFRTPAQ